MTSLPENRHGTRRPRSRQTHEEVARSLERELRLLAEERQDRARQLGLNIDPIAPKLGD